METEKTEFLSDKEIAATLRLSPAWVRKQRHLRHNGLAHTLALDAVYVGSTPRYRNTDFQNWLESL